MASWRVRELGLNVREGDIVTKKRGGQVGQQDSEEGKKQLVDGREEVELVTMANINSYSIEDVVLPLPGWDVQLPKNRCERVKSAF